MPTVRKSSARYFVLEAKQVIPTPGPRAWAQWMKFLPVAERMVGVDEVGDATVVTCFVGIKIPNQEPRLFVTTVYGGAEDQLTQCSPDLESATRKHKEIVARLRAAK
ncbi:hypothetical protein [Caldimonas sp. KR1-144]|uniref:hypothetical protein n=1 Tax=Caldimonas sp. KR1-144 TaxID=3400911 RepID=UPI003C0B2D9A